MRTYCEICEEVKEVEQHEMICWKHVCDDCYTEIERYIERMIDIRKRFKGKLKKNGTRRD